MAFETKFQRQRMNVFALSKEGEGGEGFENGGEGVVIDWEAGCSQKMEERHGDVEVGTAGEGEEERVPKMEVSAAEEAGGEGVGKALTEVAKGGKVNGEEKRTFDGEVRVWI